MKSIRAFASLCCCWRLGCVSGCFRGDVVFDCFPCEIPRSLIGSRIQDKKPISWRARHPLSQLLGTPLLTGGFGPGWRATRRSHVSFWAGVPTTRADWQRFQFRDSGVQSNIRKRRTSSPMVRPSPSTPKAGLLRPRPSTTAITTTIRGPQAFGVEPLH